jgi:hypothetical protein
MSKYSRVGRAILERDQYVVVHRFATSIAKLLNRYIGSEYSFWDRKPERTIKDLKHRVRQKRVEK